MYLPTYNILSQPCFFLTVELLSSLPNTVSRNFPPSSFHRFFFRFLVRASSRRLPLTDHEKFLRVIRATGYSNAKHFPARITNPSFYRALITLASWQVSSPERDIGLWNKPNVALFHVSLFVRLSTTDREISIILCVIAVDRNTRCKSAGLAVTLKIR